MKIIADITTGCSMGSGFMKIVSEDYAEKACASLHSADVMGRSFPVYKAMPRQTAGESAKVRQGKFKKRGSGLGNWR